MAFGPPPSKAFTGKVGTAVDQLWKQSIKAEDNCKAKWKFMWPEIIEEYNKLSETMQVMSEKYYAEQPKIGKQYPHDPRTMKPLPETTNHVIGWLASRPEFRMEIYGPDIPNDMPFKELYV